LCKKLLGDNEVKFVEEPSWQPATEIVDEKVIQESIQKRKLKN